MRIQLQNTGKGALNLGRYHLDRNGTLWTTDIEMEQMTQANPSLNFNALFASKVLTVLITEADAIQNTAAQQLIVQSPNGALWQINVANNGTVSASSYTAVAPHNSTLL